MVEAHERGHTQRLFPMLRNKMSIEATPSGLAKLLERCGIHLDAARTGQLWQYHQLLRKNNPELNLTRIHQFENMVLKLYVDSILPGLLMELPSPLLDLGTGPGMPGIPLKIAFPHLNIYLAEGRRKRVAFLNEALAALQLPGIEVIGEGISASFEKPVRGVITRAVEEIPATLARIQGCLEKEGLAIFMKGPACENEIISAQKRFQGEYALILDRAYQIPETPHQRRLVVFRHLSEPIGKRKAFAAAKHSVRILESEKNALFREMRSLLSARGIRKHRKAFVFGSRPVREVISLLPSRCIAWVTRGGETPPPGSAPPEMAWYQLAPPLWEELDLFGTGHPLLLIEVGDIPQWDPTAPLPPGCSLLVPFQDPENVGAVVRSAVAFGVSQIILLAESANPYHPKSVRASGGVVLQARFLIGPSVRELPSDLPIMALSATGQNIDGVEFPARFLLLPGMEGPGLPKEWESSSLAIPMEGAVESLNAASAAAIALYVWSQKRRDSQKSRAHLEKNQPHGPDRVQLGLE